VSRNRRILILLIVLGTGRRHDDLGAPVVRGWTRPLAVAIYPVAMDEASAAFVEQLKAEDFQEIGAFLAREAPRWRRGCDAGSACHA